MTIVDINYNQLKKLAIGAGSYFIYEDKDTYELYYANQGPIIFRAIIKKGENTLAFLSGLKSVITIMSPIKDNSNTEQLKKIIDRLESLDRFMRIGR